MSTGKRLLALTAMVVMLGWSTVQAQQRINEQDPGNTCKIAQVVGRQDLPGTNPTDEPYDDVVVSYDQPLTDIWSKRSVVWTVGAIAKASASIGLGPDGCRGTADDQPNPIDFQVYNTRRDTRCPTASKMLLDLPARELPYGYFYAAVGHGDRYSDFPTGEGVNATDIIGLKVELGTTDDPNTVHVTRALIATDKYITDAFSEDLRFIPGQIANNSSVSGRLDDFDFPSFGDDVIFRVNTEATIGSGAPYEFNWTNYNQKPAAGPAMLAEVDPGVLTSPMLDAYDHGYVMGTTFTTQLAWTKDSGTTENRQVLAPAGTTDIRGAPGFQSDYRPSGGTSRGVGALHGVGASGTDSVIFFEVDDSGIIAGNHYAITYPNPLVPCDLGVTMYNIQGAHYHGSGTFSGPFGHLAVNSSGHAAVPVYFQTEPNPPLPVTDYDGRQQAILWTDGDAQSPVWGVVAYHGQAWDPVNCQTDGVPWILGYGTTTETYPFSNPTLDNYENVFFICPYKISDTQTGIGLFRASLVPATSPPCWEIDLIVSEYDSWTDDNGVETFLTEMNSIGASGMPANGTIGSNSLVEGVLPGVDTGVPEFDPTGPLTNSGVVFAGTTLIDETPPENWLVEEACNDDNTGECPANPPNDFSDAWLTMEATSGETYFIEVTSRTFNGPGGQLDFYLECNDGLGDLGTDGNAALLADDECTGATVIPVGNVAFAPVVQDTTVATLAESDPLQSCTILFDGVSTGPRRNSHSVWYSYTPDKDCTLTVHACGSTPNDPDTAEPNDNDLFYNTVIAVYTGACGPSSTDPLINDGLKAKGRFGRANGFTFTAQAPAEIANVDLRDSLEIISGNGTTVPGFYEVIAINYAAGSMTLNANAGISVLPYDVVWQVNDNQFFGQLLYLKPYQEAVEPGCVCGDIDQSGAAVDLGDFATFAVCYGFTAPGGDCSASAFECSDMDGDTTVDLGDFATFATFYGLTTTYTVPDCVLP
ncbi:MAG: hypothetical protein JSU68_06315 [Phycisphaerales bacterium]|nr:MAG: hypothetical protein JSU68_06315 [Phycisphaerales bacterium]